MSGGISAIKGFNYQATVILSLLFDHFEQHGPTAQVRPEGLDDLDMYWSSDSIEYRRFVQIKKPREDVDGNPKPSPWSLSTAIVELFPNTVAHLIGNTHEQIWVLGDTVEQSLRELLDAGRLAPTTTPSSYWKVVHGLARNGASRACKMTGDVQGKLRRWQLPIAVLANETHVVEAIITGFEAFADQNGMTDALRAEYRHQFIQMHSSLPDVLARTEVFANYGSEQRVVERVHDLLVKQMRLPLAIVEETLFRNMRGFIDDISKQVGRSFGREEFEYELHSVWPTMIAVKESPRLAAGHIHRHDLTDRIITRGSEKVIEVVGISGSGKTSLAAEAVDRSQSLCPDRIVFYAEARRDTALRDVLAGLAFRLRRIKVYEPFRIAIDSAASTEDNLARIAHSLSTLTESVLLLLDLVEGGCSEAFARDLSIFVRSMTPPSFKLAVFGQESALRQLSDFERDEHGIHHIDVRGFSFEEFVAIVAKFHESVDRAALWDIYQRVTAGRPAGLFAKLAHSLAHAGSIGEILELAAKPANAILPHAESTRFSRISGGSCLAASKLVCFALPFSRNDAENVFAGDNVGAAIRELLALGLIRPHDHDSFEMHEIVRAGLETLIAVETRRTAHEALAAWYASRGVVTAEIFHLEMAGKREEAQSRARRIFLQGEHWRSLATYVVEKKLVSADEVVRVLSGGKPVEDQYLLSSVLRGLGGYATPEYLIQIVRENPSRFHSDHSWAGSIVEAILDSDPTRLHDLILCALETTDVGGYKHAALAWVSHGARLTNVVIEHRTLECFDRQSNEVRLAMLPLILLDRRREVLQHIFRSLASDPQLLDMQRGSIGFLHGLPLHIRDRSDSIEFLAAVPPAATADMLVAKSTLLGPLATFVWSKREILRQHCIEIVRDGIEDEAVLSSALRVLIFLAEPSVLALCATFVDRGGALSAFASLIPTLMPALADHNLYEERLLNTSLPLEKRLAALSILAALGADLGPVYQRLREAEGDPIAIKFWEALLLVQCSQAPFVDAVPLLERRLSAPGEKDDILLPPIILKMGELGAPSVTAVLARALSHRDPRVRQTAAQALSRRRSAIALASLVTQYKKEGNEFVAMALITAIVASGTNSIDDISGPFESSQTAILWRCILATRLHEVAISDQLVAIANDKTQIWQIRRSAIFAAGSLPYEVALERIASNVLHERSSLLIDESGGLLGHAVIASIVLHDPHMMLRIFCRGKAEFSAFFAPILEECWKASITAFDLPSGSEAAAWLFDRFSYYGWPTNGRAADFVINELHIPILHSAVLRSYRLCGRQDLIEGQLGHAYSVWFAMKCILERCRAAMPDGDLSTRLKALVAASAWKDSARLNTVIAECCNTRIATSETMLPRSDGPASAKQSPSFIRYDDVVQAVSMPSSEVKLIPPFVLGTVSIEQYERLIRLLDPLNDRSIGTETFIPSIQFLKNGHVVGQRQVTSSGGGDSLPAFFRPAVAAANRFGVTIPWHDEMLTGAFGYSYVPKFLDCLHVQDDSDRFYEELARNPEALLGHICNPARQSSVLSFVDHRIIPYLSRYAFSGTDEFFSGLCTLARRVTDPAISSVLASLFYRWTQRFDLKAVAEQHSENHHLWRAFKELTDHPRFGAVEGWQLRLGAVATTAMRWYRRQDIARVLERDPRSYVQIECMLFKVANFEHFHVDEIDRLDTAADRLFHELLEP